ncbi:unnamed protein product [Paramecium pentaurelia]|uniref:Peptidase M14 domain-containing protein n=1 Tax=Paramecium pentaurelia TaxID=43138 RepID=A0A8S1TJP9_9CILI|nr:unnamed protein product [Paramecium pentaurelia]
MFILLLLNISFALPDFYHQFDSINLNQYSNCAKIETLIEDPKVDIITINENAKFKAFLMFGEHARELISPETGLHLLDSICNNKYDVSKYQIKMVLNLNPLSRMRVENGEYCLRLNENNVDLNRNYDAHFKQYTDMEMQTNSGPEPFSEPETKAVRDLLKSYKPNMFLSIHSGSAGLFTPHAYSMEEPQNYEELMKVLNVIREDHCPMCETGLSSKNVGYLAFGSAMDYAYDEIGIKNSYLFEIYHKDVNMINDLRVESIKKQKRSFLELKDDDLSNQECFDYFNPKEKEQYDWYTQNWSDAIIKTLSLVESQQNDEIILAHN